MIGVSFHIEFQVEKLAGLPTWLVLTIGGCAAFVVVAGLVGFLLYRKKMKLRKEYTPIKDGSE